MCEFHAENRVQISTIHMNKSGPREGERKRHDFYVWFFVLFVCSIMRWALYHEYDRDFGKTFDFNAFATLIR